MGTNLEFLDTTLHRKGERKKRMLHCAKETILSKTTNNLHSSHLPTPRQAK